MIEIVIIQQSLTGESVDIGNVLVCPQKFSKIPDVVRSFSRPIVPCNQLKKG